MDVIKIIVIIAATHTLIACKKGDAGQVFTPHQNDECVGQQVPKEFLVKWKSGRITIENGENNDSFVEEFIEPQIDEIEHVERNHFLKIIAPVDNQKLETKNSAFVDADNWGQNLIKAQYAWKNNYYGENIIVAIIDDGVNIDHSQLRNNIYYNPGESGLDERGEDKSTNGFDDDQNGYIDDFSGYNFATRSPFNTDTSGHGTHVAGVIVADHNDVDHQTGYVQGIAPKATLLPLDFIERRSGGTVAQAVEAIDYAIMMGAKIINASWGGSYCSKLLKEAVLKTYEHDVIFVAAAGNSSNNTDYFPEFPASHSGLTQITVGSSSMLDNMAQHSNYGENTVHIFAPGQEIYSTFPPNTIHNMTGTSMATPFVSGVAALVWSLNPNASAIKIKELLLQNVKSSSNYRNLSHGRIDVPSVIDAMESQLP